MDNLQRTESVEAYLDSFAKAMGLENDDATTIAGDMICNILHWVSEQFDGPIEIGRTKALQAMQFGIAHYVSERSIDYDDDPLDEVGPDALVTINVECDDKIWRTATGATPEVI